MMAGMTAGLRLSAPGIYRSPQRVEPSFQPVRLDIAGFVGVALRGPVDTPTLVTSWTDYQRWFGGFESPEGLDGPDRLLPYAVQAFFDQGGERAWVVRVAPPDDPDGADATAQFTLTVGTATVPITAANEGSWGNSLRIRLEFEVAQWFQVTADSAGDLELPDGVSLAPRSLLRIRQPGALSAGVLRFGTEVVPLTVGTRRRLLELDEPLPVAADCQIAVVTGVLVVEDGDQTFPRQERISRLGLHSEHPRFIGRVLPDESILVAPTGNWSVPLVPSDALLRPVTAEGVQPGSDRWASISYCSFFDSGDVAEDPLDEAQHRGVDKIGRNSEIGLLCVPDLLWRWQDSVAEPEAAQRALGGGCFEPCPVEPAPPASTCYAASPAAPAVLDVQQPDQLQDVIKRQQRLVAVAQLRRRFVALLDVPPGLAVAGITSWRAGFDSSFAAAYHPWLGVPRAGDPRGEIVPVPPSAFAAGIIAGRERRLGLPWGPANELAARAVTSTAQITDALHDQLHLLGINIYRSERDGFRLSAARTLSSDPAYRQLNVRRLMTMIILALERESQWLVFEPNATQLQGLLLHSVTQFLRALYQQRAFAGDTEEQSFFVRCDDQLTPPQTQSLGRLVAEIGVAPAAPLEYLVLRITQDADGTVQVVSPGG